MLTSLSKQSRTMKPDSHLLNEDRFEDLVDPIILANYLATRDKTRSPGLQQMRIVQQIRLHVHQVSNNHLEVVENAFDRLQVRAVGRETEERHAIVAQKGVADVVVDGRVVEQHDAVGCL